MGVGVGVGAAHEGGGGPGFGFPYEDLSKLTGSTISDAAAMVEALSPFLLEGRADKIKNVVAQRTFSVLPVVEGLYNMGNLAAVCRSADGESCTLLSQTSSHAWSAPQPWDSGPSTAYPR